jgi:Cu/Zn superoxide dismutase
VDNSASGTVYKGLAFAQSGGSNYIYATDFHNGKVDVFDSNYNPATLAGSFADPSIPSGFAPFGIEPVKGQLYVTYALQNAAKHDDVSGAGNGFVNVFDTSGNLVKRLISHGVLNSPWGLALAPTGFGPFSGTLLVGNFGDGHINAFDPNTGTALGTLNDSTGAAFTVDGLWGIKFGNGGSGGDAHTLYYTAGIPGTGVVEDHGLFGSLTPVFPTFLSDTDQGLAVALTWAGGAAPYLLQKKADLSAPSWVDVLTTSNRSAMVAKDGGEGLFRLVNPAPNVVLSFTVLMNGASEVSPTTSTASGMGTLSLEGSNLTYNISFSGLTAPATAAHIHAPGTATNSASVIIPLTSVPAATAGTISGVAVVTQDQITNIIGGLAYANIHTANFPGGEIRGQVVPLHMVVPLNGASEVSAVTTTATGTASLTFIGSQMFYTVSYSGLSGAATASHIHGPAATTNNASVIIPFNTPSGTSGSISGSVSLTPTQLTWLLSGQTYVNVHTTTNPGGEIRGQVYPFTFGATMNGASEVGPTTSPGTGQASLTLVNGVLSWGINFTNLTAAATAAHIHGPADTAHNASVIIPFSAPAATSGVISGSAALTSAQLFDIVSGLSYANIHTSTSPGGEIRGQVLPNN